MRVRILLSLSVLLLLSVGAATAVAARPVNATQQLCEGYGGTYSPHAKTSFFRPFFKNQGVVWTCNSYSGGSTASQALVAACVNDGGQETTTLDGPPGFATCWKRAST
jgi:hypothetical protein